LGEEVGGNLCCVLSDYDFEMVVESPLQEEFPSQEEFGWRFWDVVAVWLDAWLMLIPILSAR
jgi:hypothetical protein